MRDSRSSSIGASSTSTGKIGADSKGWRERALSSVM